MKRGFISEAAASIIGPFVILLAMLAVPFNDHETRHLKIHWQRDFDSAQRMAQASRKPILAVAIAGELNGRC
jgi:hypothetical protein